MIVCVTSCHKQPLVLADHKPNIIIIMIDPLLGCVTSAARLPLQPSLNSA